jgi:hypothetical protein
MHLECRCSPGDWWPSQGTVLFNPWLLKHMPWRTTSYPAVGMRLNRAKLRAAVYRTAMQSCCWHCPQRLCTAAPVLCWLLLLHCSRWCGHGCMIGRVAVRLHSLGMQLAPHATLPFPRRCLLASAAAAACLGAQHALQLQQCSCYLCAELAPHEVYMPCTAVHSR